MSAVLCWLLILVWYRYCNWVVCSRQKVSSWAGNLVSWLCGHFHYTSRYSRGQETFNFFRILEQATNFFARKIENRLNAHPFSHPVQIFSALRSYCSRLSFVLFLYESRSTLIRRDGWEKIGRVLTRWRCLNVSVLTLWARSVYLFNPVIPRKFRFYKSIKRQKKKNCEWLSLSLSLYAGWDMVIHACVRLYKKRSRFWKALSQIEIRPGPVIIKLQCVCVCCLDVWVGVVHSGSILPEDDSVSSLPVSYTHLTLPTTPYV